MIHSEKMISFDHAYVVQFAVFFDPEAGPSAEGITRLPALFSKVPEGVASLGLKLGHAQTSQGMVMQASGAVSPGPNLTWTVGAGVWRVIASHSRFDIHFDARGFAEVTESELATLTTVRERLVTGLSQLPEVLGQRVIRLALILTAQGSAQGMTPSVVVAKTFFRPDLVSLGERGDLVDTVARANYLTKWKLGTAGEILINRNESGSAIGVVRNDVEETILSWQLDVNTSPKEVANDVSFDAESIKGFFSHADAWITAQLAKLQAQS